VKNGWEGIVVYGAVRDVAQLAELDVGVLATGTNPRKSSQRDVGERDVPLEILGVRIDPARDFVVVDEDGVVVLDVEEAQRLGVLAKL